MRNHYESNSLGIKGKKSIREYEHRIHSHELLNRHNQCPTLPSLLRLQIPLH